MNRKKSGTFGDKKIGKRRRAAVLMLLAVLMLCAGGCGKKKKEDAGSEGKPADKVHVKPAADLETAVYCHADENTGENIRFYLAWGEDGSDMRVVFFGDGSEGTVDFTETDGGYYCGIADELTICGKKYDGERIAVKPAADGTADLKIGAGEAGVLKCDGEAWISPAPFGTKGIFFGYQLSPLMILSGDGFLMTAEMSDERSDTYCVENIFYCAEMQDAERKYTLRNISSLPGHAVDKDVFWVLDNYYGNDRALNLVWLHVREDGTVDESLNGFTTYYYRFYDNNAPADYQNRDGEGKWGAMEYDANDSLFVPKTEDYIVRCQNTTTGVYYSDAKEYRNYDTKVFELYAYSGTGENVQTLRKTVFPDADAARDYEKYVGSYLQLTVKGNVVYEDRSAYDCYVGKQERLLTCIGGITTYADHCYYEDVHYYRFEEILFDQVTQVYVSAPPKKLSVQEHMSVIGRKGIYEAGEGQIRLGCDYDSYYVEIMDTKIGTMKINEKLRDIRFDENGFYAFLKKEDCKLVLRADYMADGLKVKYDLFQADAAISDYGQGGSAPQQTIEKTYSLRGK